MSQTKSNPVNFSQKEKVKLYWVKSSQVESIQVKLILTELEMS